LALEASVKLVEWNTNPTRNAHLKHQEKSVISDFKKLFLSSMVICSVADPDPGSGIRCLFNPWIRDPGWEKVSIRIRDEQPGSYFLELRNQFFCFFGVKILKFFDEDPGSAMETVRIRDPVWKKVGSGIRDKSPGSATLVI
jgi:hypothetical protein